VSGRRHGGSSCSATYRKVERAVLEIVTVQWHEPHYGAPNVRVISPTHALLFAASTLAFGCAVDQRALGPGPDEAAIGLSLVTEPGVELDSLRYDVNARDGSDVIDGSLDVSSRGAELSFGIERVPPGDYELSLVAVGMHAGSQSLCLSDPVFFSVLAGQPVALPPVTLTCLVQDPANQTWSVSPGDDIRMEGFAVDGEAVAFTYTPAAVKGHLNTAGVCAYSPVVIEFTAFADDLEFALDATPDGGYAAGNPSLAQVTYVCASDGDKRLSVGATRGSTTVTKSYVVNCSSSCAPGGPICGNGIVEAGEECDEQTARCSNCTVHPRCGDGVVDAPEQCDAVALPTASCSVNCRNANAP